MVILPNCSLLVGHKQLVEKKKNHILVFKFPTLLLEFASKHSSSHAKRILAQSMQFPKNS